MSSKTSCKYQDVLITQIEDRLHRFKRLHKMEERDSLTEKIIGCCFKIHKELGPGFNEKIYQNALKNQFELLDIKYKTEKEYEVKYLDKKVGSLRVDMVVEDKVIVELKALTGNIPHMCSILQN